ncbi:MAG TPA: efflux RND transporter periplasmic adaptor subunit [Phycisphaerae bacterium]|nr:efflux RND transporter periplasmic adaptor subunit [Phycisphaerae bacterium]
MPSSRLWGCYVAIMGVAWLPMGCDRATAPPALPLPIVTVSQPLLKEVSDYIEYTGTTSAIETVDVRARVMGFLQSVNFEPRSKVKKDELLFVIDPNQYQAEYDQACATLAARKAQYDLATYAAGRTADLYMKDSAAEYERNTDMAKMFEAKAAVQAAEANLAEAKLNLGYTQVTAPIAGRVSRNLVDVGNLVGASDCTLLTTIVNDDSVYVYFDVSENDLLALKRMHERQTSTTTRPEKITAPAFLALADEVGYPHEGRVDFADTHLDTSTGTISVRAIFPNSQGELLPGLFARVRVPVSKPRQVLMVSERALGSDQGQRYLLVVNDKDQVEYRRVKVGRLEEELRVIEEGIGPTDRVIVSGLQRARPGTTVSPQQAPAPGAGEAKTAPAAAPGDSSRIYPKTT